MGDEQKRLARYANWFNIGHNSFEFILDFGQQHAADEGVIVHTRIVLGPAYAKVLGRLLNQSLDRYEGSFGEIPNTANEEPQRPC